MAARAAELAEAHELLVAGQRAHLHLAWRITAHRGASAGWEHYRRGAELARRAGLTAAQIHILAQMVHKLLYCGKLEESQQTLCRLRVLLEDLHEPTRARLSLLDSELRYLAAAGQWEACAQQARPILASMRERGPIRDLALFALLLGWAILESRRLGSAPHAGEWQEAEAALAEATGILDRSLAPTYGIWTRVAWGFLCVCQGRLCDARQLLAEANEVAMVMHWPPSMEGQRLWLEGQVAAAGEEWAESIDWFESACRALSDAGHRWYCARVRLDWAEVHVSRDEPGDRQRATELLREARDAFQDMGVPRYAAIAQERLQELGVKSLIPVERASSDASG